MEGSTLPAIGKILHLTKKICSDPFEQIWTCCVSAVMYISFRTLQIKVRSMSRHQGQDIITWWQGPRKTCAAEIHSQGLGGLRALNMQEHIQPRKALHTWDWDRGERSRQTPTYAWCMVKEDKTVMLLSEFKHPCPVQPMVLPGPSFPGLLPSPVHSPALRLLPVTWHLILPATTTCQPFTFDGGSRNMQRSDIFSDTYNLPLLQHVYFWWTWTFSTGIHSHHFLIISSFFVFLLLRTLQSVLILVSNTCPVCQRVSWWEKYSNRYIFSISLTCPR